MKKVSEIRQEAQKVLSKNDVRKEPVDIYSLIEHENIRILFEDMEDDHSGFLLVENGKSTVAINKSHHPNRQRFTAAHELGHFFLHAKGEDLLFVDKAFKRNSVSSTGDEVLEIEANRFAAEILMPKKILEKRIQECEITDIVISEIASDFKVSEQAMTLRLVNLGLISN